MESLGGFGLILAIGSLVVKVIALYNTSTVERLFLSMESNLLIKGLEKLLFSMSVAYLLTYGYYLFNHNVRMESLFSLFGVSTVIILIISITVLPLPFQFINRVRNYYLVDGKKKLYIVKTTFNKKILLSNNPSPKKKVDRTFFQIVEQEYLIGKEIREE
jgi:hypothetical protein